MTTRFGHDPKSVAAAADLLRVGKLVAFGTETVYGLGALASSPETIARVYAAKSRPSFNPLISHFASAEAAFEHGVASAFAHRLAAAFWPGPMTLILPRHPGSHICDLACAGLSTVALRVPASVTARALLAQVGAPVAAPSANLSGCVSPTTAEHVLAGLDGRIDAVLDTGPCETGIESTVIDLSTPCPRILRPGGLTLEAIRDRTGQAFSLAPQPNKIGVADHALPGPGMLESHYAPQLSLRLDAKTCAPDEALLAFGPSVLKAPLVFNLSEGSDLTEAAARLYAGLHYLDAVGQARQLCGIAAMPMPNQGIGLAITDRLRRAAAPRHDGSKPPEQGGTKND